jgi:hypothetical protein
MIRTFKRKVKPTKKQAKDGLLEGHQADVKAAQNFMSRGAALVR